MARLGIIWALALVPAGMPGQSAAPVAASYLDRYREVVTLAPVPGRVADVTHVVLKRDVAQLTFERGQLYLLSAVGGRTVAAVFHGSGRFTLASTEPVERAELERFAGSPTLDDTLTEAILIFADSTADAFGGLTFAPAPIPGEVGDHVRDLLGSLKGSDEGSLRSDMMGPLLNGETSGFFLARIERKHGGGLLFQINPAVSEAVQLFRPVSRLRWGANWIVVSQFPLQRPLLGTAKSWLYRDRLDVPSYRLDASLTPTASGMDVAASATLSLKAVEPAGPWLLFGLDSTLVVDSATWGAGEVATVFKAKGTQDLWVRVGRRLETGDSTALRLFYHNDSHGLIDRFGDWFVIDPGAWWYPVNRQGPSLATFDLTFHSPVFYPLASIGDRTDSSVVGKVLTTHWVTRTATSSATFNLGVFENYHVQHPGAPTLDVLLSEEAHRRLERELMARGRMLPQQKHMRENVAADVSNSLKLFTSLFGDCPFDHFYVTEIPYDEGVSFPGMIDLSWGTFQTTSLDGFDEFFRAHEVAHQWWGNGVRSGSYRDAWLSEGLASFSALWYLQSERKRNDEYMKFLDRYKDDIKDETDDVGPIWIGYRNATPTARRGYDVVIYEKGAWVFHMLRILMLDVGKLSQERFAETMKDFYQSYRGKPATTDDFQGVVERHAGVPMDWFFDEWVRGTGIPTYHVAWTSQPAADGKYTIRLRVTQERVPTTFQMPVLVSADLGNNRFAHFRVAIRGDQTEYQSPLLPAAPKGIEFNALHAVLADVKMEAW
jgi:peptidase M1-like protein